jgi:HSP20 family molecular chaperone IbpA
VAEKQELQVQKKQEVEKAQESTTPTRAFIPSADIYESEDALTVVLEMPGVSRDGIDVTIEDGVLTIEGRIDFSKYDGLQPLYSEYNVGPYRRSFRISSQIEQGRITAKLQDGIITLDLPKAEATKPRRIQVS